MAIYRVLDIYNRISELKQDKIEYVDITVLDPDEDEPESLNFEGLDEFGGIDYESVPSVTPPQD